MLTFLKNHPFAVEAFFEKSYVFTFAVPKEQIQELIPDCLELDTFENKWAFIAVAMVQTRSLRPKGFPVFLGNNFFLIGYRVFVRYITLAGKNLRGLYILKSETDKKKMELFGNLFTHYNYTTTDITQSDRDDTIDITSRKSDFYVKIEKKSHSVSIPPGSPFSDWKEARRFAGPLPFTFTYNPMNKNVLIIQGMREDWNPIPIKVLDYRFSFIENFKFDGIQLANAFVIVDVPYWWKKGKLEKWNN